MWAILALMAQNGSMRARPRVLLALVAAVSAALTLSLTGGADARPAPIGQDKVVPGQVYTGDFPDPAVMRIGQRYYAYSTTSDRINVPMLTSTDLRAWTAVPGSETNPTGDALPHPPAWAAAVEQEDGRFHATTWAPTVTRVAPRRFVLVYSIEVAGQPGRMCISRATATTPYGPFIDNSTGPLVCPARGAIDPQIFIAPTGRPWLVWKVDRKPALIFTRAMNKAGTALLPGTRPRYLAKVARPWEGSVIENPAMIKFRKKYYLFYSANSWSSPRYAIGYMICKTWYGGCKRARKGPLIASDAEVHGPGGAMPFIDAAGRLRLAYHGWRAGAVGYPRTTECLETEAGCPQRRLYVAMLRPNKAKKLIVVRRR